MASRWHPDEDEQLRRGYRAGEPLASIARAVGRSEDAVAARRAALGLPRRRSSRPWSALEDVLLREAAGAGLPATALARRLGRPVEQVRNRRRHLALGRSYPRRYTSTEDAVLRSEWASGGVVGALAQRLGRSSDALRLRAEQLGLHRPAPRRRWSAAEDVVVRDGYANGLTCEQIAAELTPRTATAVAARGRRLGLATYGRQWTTNDDACLRRILQHGSVDHAARRLGRTPEAIRRRARTLGLAAPSPAEPRRSGARWTAEEDGLLVLHAGLNPAVLGALLGRSDHAIAARLRHLGLRAGRWRSPHHPSPSGGGLTPGERALVERELRDRGVRAVPSLEDRLQRRLPSTSKVTRASGTAHRGSGPKAG